MTGISHPATTAEPVLWRGMDRAALDTAYDNSRHVADSAEHLARWTARSVALRAAHPALLDQRYGPRERNAIDIFRCGQAGAPLFVFIHGGYWQRNSKTVFSSMAEGPLAHGIDVAVPGYTLAPEATLSEIVAEIRAALGWLRSEGPALGVATGKLVVSGWSAGGHLAASAMAWPGVDAGLAISGVFDLEPIRLGVLNEKLRLGRSEAAVLSPMLRLPAHSGPLALAFGTGELPELQRQSRDYGRALAAAGLPVQMRPLAGENHFSILDQLVSPDGGLTAILRSLI